MNKLKYMIKRIFKMNYKGFFTTICFIHNKTKKSRVFIFFDMIYTGIKFQAGYMDYKLFEMYNMNNKEKATIITRGVNNNYIKLLNDPEDSKIFHDKVLFNEKFKEYLNRDYLYLKDKDYSDFVLFCNKHSTFIAKPVDGSCGTNIEVIRTNKNNRKKVYDSIISKKQFLIEEMAIQCEKLSSLHPTSVNTLRVITIGGEVVSAFLRIGNNNNVVDNFNHGGMAAPINIETGVIEFPAIDKSENLYYKHPLTNTSIVGFKIPMWNKVKSLCKNASKVVLNVKLVGWDICVGDNKLFIIEANEFPGHDIYQLPPHRKGNIGLKPIFDEAIKNIKIN